MSKNETSTNDKESITNKDSIFLEDSNLQWNNTIDQLLARWCDNAKCFEWMHNESCYILSKKAKNFMIIINVFTAFSGLTNLITGGFVVNGFQIAWLFGSISILTSSLNMLQDKLAYAANAEKHRKLASQWCTIRNKIEEVVILPPNSRRDCKTFLRYIKADMNLAATEGNFLISEEIRSKCYDKFKNIENFDIPDICGQMEHTRVFFDINIENNNDLKKLL
jgi:hypothetical protein